MAGPALVRAQSRVGEGGKSPVVALKTNGLYWATTTPNVGIEVRLAPKWTLEAEVGLNPFDGKNDDGSFDQSIKHFRLIRRCVIGSARASSGISWGCMSLI